MHHHEAQDPDQSCWWCFTAGRQHLERHAGQVRMREAGRAHPVNSGRWRGCGHHGVQHVAVCVVVDRRCGSRTLLHLDGVETDVCRHLAIDCCDLSTVDHETSQTARYEVNLSHQSVTSRTEIYSTSHISNIWLNITWMFTMCVSMVLTMPVSCTFRPTEILAACLWTDSLRDR